MADDVVVSRLSWSCDSTELLLIMRRNHCFLFFNHFVFCFPSVWAFEGKICGVLLFQLAPLVVFPYTLCSEVKKYYQYPANQLINDNVPWIILIFNKKFWIIFTRIITTLLHKFYSDNVVKKTNFFDFVRWQL